MKSNKEKGRKEVTEQRGGEEGRHKGGIIFEKGSGEPEIRNR